jgi:hypothetical protein
VIEQAAGPWAGCLRIKVRDLRRSIGDPFNQSRIPKSGYRFSEKDHAPPITQSGMTNRREVITL